MFHDKRLTRLLMGRIGFSDQGVTRTSTVIYPATPDHEEIEVEFRGDDGLIYHLLTRIEALEKQIKK